MHIGEIRKKTYYANNYAKSSIREWLNDVFYNTSFSASQKTVIEYTSLNTTAYSDSSSIFDSETTHDKVYLLSLADITNPRYGFSQYDDSEDIYRRAQGSDYAKCQGLYVYNYGESQKGNSNWNIRSPGFNSSSSGNVFSDGYVSNGGINVGCTEYGVRPALNINLKSEIFQSYVMDVGYSDVIITGYIVKPSQATVNYGDSIVLHADFDRTLPDRARVEWTADNGNFSMSVSADGTACKISPKSSGKTVFTATVYDKDGDLIGSDMQEMTAKAGFFDKIIAFFKKVFGLTKTIPEAFKGIL